MSLRRSYPAASFTDQLSILTSFRGLQARRNHTDTRSSSQVSGASPTSDTTLREPQGPDGHATVRIELTPNPQARKFVIENGPLLGDAAPGTSRSYTQQQLRPHGESPLADRLFKVDGLSSVLIARDYITVVKSRDVEWQDVEELVTQCILDQLRSGVPAFRPTLPSEEFTGTNGVSQESGKESKAEEQEDLSEAIRELLHMRARPMLQADGGDLEMMRFDEDTGIVWVHLKGSCEGCPSSLITVKRGMKQMLQYYIPEVEDVRQCDENGDPLEDEEEEE
ncbi:NifU family domain-containing protein [Besnoitia besnoiti]|uniref:NifU family domain-containing protein n=1 Tax=Besnoitia besnoiti TaxID=94643 RepID=A0A2A9MJV4_BESBE|nr:NifU family domain-containing protein [Besnoitia besnoiti]PFH36531.1 NifU family domain-containing protein [Besnoitia besnoiti]